MNVHVSAGVSSNGSVVCVINVDGREAAVTFADGEILFEAPTEGGAISLDVPEELIPVEPS